jgi:pseudoazurin
MKNKIFLLILPLCFMFIFNGKKYEEAVIDRLLVQVNICLEGQDCGSPSQMSQVVASSPVEAQKVEQMIFEPAVLKVSVGDTIHFKAADMSHNSAVIDGMLPAGAEAWAGQMNMDISVTLDTEGVYVYQCDPHVMMAMIGVIQVGEATNMNDIKAATNILKSSFVMNAERIDTYLSQL